MEVFAKSDDERDFYIDALEGFLIYVDLDKTQEELDALEDELKSHPGRYFLIPKLSFYEVKKIMEGFVNEKIYDIDTKEKLLDIIQAKEARENFLEFVYDHHSELEKWQQYYQERFRIRIIEWLRQNRFDFVFEEDLEMTKSLIEKLKLHLFSSKAPKEVIAARKILVTKAKTYYSNEALHPRPRRGRPPKQVAKVEIEPQFALDMYTQIPKAVKSFLFTPEYQGSLAIYTFSHKFASEAELLAHKKKDLHSTQIEALDLNKKLATLRAISAEWLPQASVLQEVVQAPSRAGKTLEKGELTWNDEEDETEEAYGDIEEVPQPAAARRPVKPAPVKVASRAAPVKVVPKAVPVPVKAAPKVVPKMAPKAVQVKTKKPVMKTPSRPQVVPTKKAAVKSKERLRPLVKKKPVIAPQKSQKPKASALRPLRRK